MSLSTKITMVGGVGYPAVVLVARGRAPVFADLHAPGHMSCIISIDAEFTWPDRRGISLKAIVDLGETAALAFERLGDALVCKARIDRAGFAE